jgi:hypothetical protein
MNTKSFDRSAAERLMPLLHSIGREMRERTREVDHLEQRLDSLSEMRQVHGEEVASLESQLSTHRRELRRIETELGHLGCHLDADHPLRIVIPSEGGTFAWEGRLADTQYYRRAAIDQTN